MSSDKIILPGYIQCPACELEQAGPFHRKSRRLWQERADKARRELAEAKAKLDEAEKHLKVIDES